MSQRSESVDVETWEKALSAEKFLRLKPRAVGAAALGAATLFWACTSLAATAPAPAPAAAAAAPASNSGSAPAAGATDMAHAKTTFEALCNGCHESALATDARYSRKGWEGVVERMYGFGLSATDAQAKEIVDYLAKNYSASE